jgi:hypothetical protein
MAARVPMLANRTAFSVPEIDSIWKAKDGRRVRVCKITETPHVKGGWWATLFVLPPRSYRQRVMTTANAESFSSGFYTLEVE